MQRLSSMFATDTAATAPPAALPPGAPPPGALPPGAPQLAGAPSGGGQVMQQASWPQQNAPPGAWPANGPQGPGAQNQRRLDSLDVFDPTVTVAMVGDQYILRGELLGDANIMLAPYIEKLKPDEIEEKRAQIMADRDRMAQQLLRQAIERKLMYLEFLRGIPTDKLAEAQANIKSRIGTAFETELDEMIEKVQKADESKYAELARSDAQLFRLAFLMKEQNLTTHRQLEELLRRYGSSLEKQKQAFAERKLGQQALLSGIERQPEITHEEMLTYYRQHIEEFNVPMQARWEQLTARFDHFTDKTECGKAIAAMGNEVWLGGAPMAAVAKRSSQGARADKGGYHDWTDWGDLEVSREVQQHVFSLPPQKLSQIIEDAEGLHIIRVIERRDARTVPFDEAQTAIKEQLQNEKRQVQIQEFVVRLRSQTPIWTIYDGAEPTDRVAEPPAGPGAGRSR